MKKLLFVAMACVLCIGLVGGAFAYFSDTETSTGNTFTAGTLDLVLGGDIPITLTNMAPGHASIDYVINFENTGSIDGNLTFGVTIVGEADGDVTAPDGSGTNDINANQYASKVNITKLEWGTDDILSWWETHAGNNVAPLTLLELANAGSIGGATLEDGEDVDVTFGFTLDSGVNNAYQGEGCEASLTATLTSS